jgi:hypothetical protein
MNGLARQLLISQTESARFSRDARAQKLCCTIWTAELSHFLVGKEAPMLVQTKKVSEEFVLDKSTRLVVLEARANKVKFGILDRGEGPRENRKETAAPPERRTGKTVKIIAPYGEEIEIDG